MLTKADAVFKDETKLAGDLQKARDYGESGVEIVHTAAKHALSAHTLRVSGFGRWLNCLKRRRSARKT